MEMKDCLSLVHCEKMADRCHSYRYLQAFDQTGSEKYGNRKSKNIL